MSEPAVDADVSNAAKIDDQHRFLPSQWRSVDHAILRLTQWSLFAIGTLFTAMITLEVVSRYVFSFSIFFVNAAARFLLVWFFLVGAGLALRYGAHVGFELVVALLPGRWRRHIVIIAQALALIFFAEMVWGGLYSLGPAMNQTEPGLEIRLVWAFLAIPVGFALLIYHMIVLMLVELRRPVAHETRP